MQIKTKIKGDPVKIMQAALQKELEKTATDTAERARLELAVATPKDTGQAAFAWKITGFNANKGSFILENDTPYIGVLNAGHSSQAPRHFIEKVVMSFGRATGVIVNYR
jgi:hypothetical protein